MNWPDRIFVTGTNTDIGKTVIAGILVSGLESSYWKPVQTGLTEGTDSDWIRDHTDISPAALYPEVYSLQEPLSPHAAAELENVSIDLAELKMPEISAGERLIIEGAGGLLVPLNREHYMLDLIVQLQTAVVLVVSSQLGTINHTLMSVHLLRERQVPILGVVMNGDKNPGNREAIEYFGKVQVLAEVETVPTLDAEGLRQTFRRNFSSPDL